MTKVIEDVPAQLQSASTAAVNWINEKRGTSYMLTGLVDPDLMWQPEAGLATEMALVLCDDGSCAREQIRIQMQDDGYQIASIDAQDTLIPPHLDPPQHTRRSWLDGELSKHKFIVIVFYRGFW